MTAPRGRFAISASLVVLAVSPLIAEASQDTTAAAVPPIDQDSVPFFVPRREITPLTASEVPRGAFAPGTRYRFTRQSMMWSGAFTLADLLGAIPGVFIARGGFFGQPEYVMYGGRGAASVAMKLSRNYRITCYLLQIPILKPYRRRS